MRDPAASDLRKGWTIPQGVAVAAVLLALVGAGILLWSPFGAGTGRADPDDHSQITLGRSVYAANCASCHGDRLQGQPNWQERRPDGKLPAPPHDASGHSWHHPDGQLFDIVKRGIGPYAPPGYESDMPAFRGVLKDKEIWAVLALIKSTWPAEIRARQSRINQQTKQ